MAHESTINDPAYLSDKISRNYILLGIVRNIVYVELRIGTGDKEHDVIEHHEWLNIKRTSVTSDDTNETIPPHCNQWVKVLALKHERALENLNYFLINAVNDFFQDRRDG